MITIFTLRELHQLSDRLRALRLRLEVEGESGATAPQRSVRDLVSQAVVSVDAAVREAEAVAREQHHKA